MTIKPKTIVLDVDGTLTLPKMMEPTENVKQALQNESRHGNEVVIATGRPLHTAIPIGLSVGSTPITLLTSNGNLTLSYPDRTILSYHTLDKASCLPIVEFMAKEGLCAYLVLANKEKIIAGEDDSNVRVSDYMSIYYQQHNKPVELPEMKQENFQNNDKFIQPASYERVKEMMDYDILNLHLHPIDEEQTDIYIDLLKQFENDKIVVKKSGSKIIEMFNPEINKGVVLNELNYEGLVVYMGDSENDIPGIEWAVEKKGFGVAMGNAFDSVKEVANYITTSVYEDGVVDALNYINNL